MNFFKHRTRNNSGHGNNIDCVCPKCGYTTQHQRGTPCATLLCPVCKSALKRQDRLNNFFDNNSKPNTREKKIPEIIPSLCKGCAACVAICPFEAINIINGKAVIDTNTCRGCAKCVKSCEYGAIQFLDYQKKST